MYGRGQEQEKAEFLHTDCFFIRKEVLSGKASESVFEWQGHALSSRHPGEHWRCVWWGVLCESAEKRQKNEGAGAEMGPVRLIECLCVSRSLYHPTPPHPLISP